MGGRSWGLDDWVWVGRDLTMRDGIDIRASNAGRFNMVLWQDW